MTENDEWEYGPHLPTSGRPLAVSLSENNILLFGFYPNDQRTFLYEVKTQSFNELGHNQFPRYGASAQLVTYVSLL